MTHLEKALKEARAMVASGWHEPFSLGTDGKLCTAHDEMIARYCTHDALHLAAVSIADPLWMEQLLCKLLGLGEWGFPEFAAWLEAPERKQADVLHLFDRAILRAKAVA